MTCLDGGYQWANLSMFGDLFPTLHVAAVIMHGVVVVIIFYRFPKKFLFPESKGYFLTVEEAYKQIYQNTVNTESCNLSFG